MSSSTQDGRARAAAGGCLCMRTGGLTSPGCMGSHLWNRGKLVFGEGEIALLSSQFTFSIKPHIFIEAGCSAQSRRWGLLCFQQARAPLTGWGPISGPGLGGSGFVATGGPVVVGNIGVIRGAVRSEWVVCGTEARALPAAPAAGLSQLLQLGRRRPADRSRHISSFLTWVPFFSSLSTAHFISASLHHRSICNVNRETQGSFSFGLVYGRIPRGIQNVLTQINGTNKSKISLAT